MVALLPLPLAVPTTAYQLLSYVRSPDYRKMFAECELDCVFVAAPARYHAEIVAAALGGGLHVFCEKPFALDPGIGYRLADEAERKGLVNQVSYHVLVSIRRDKAKIGHALADF
jgi:predicted dehydrogenase